MAKYVIEIEDEPFGRNDDPVIPHGMDELYRARGFKSLVFDQNGLDKLTPYTEPDENEIRQKVEQEVWEFVKALYGLSDEELYEIFPNGCPYEMTYQEAKAKYEAWRKQKDEVRIGDEIEYDGCNGQEKLVVFKINNGMYTGIGTAGDYSVFDSIFDAWNWVRTNDMSIRKTGRNFPEIAELLKKMREESDD